VEWVELGSAKLEELLAMGDNLTFSAIFEAVPFTNASGALSWWGQEEWGADKGRRMEGGGASASTDRLRFLPRSEAES
jgi:hypothetical protein